MTALSPERAELCFRIWVVFFLSHEPLKMPLTLTVKRHFNHSHPLAKTLSKIKQANIKREKYLHFNPIKEEIFIQIKCIQCTLQPIMLCVTLSVWDVSFFMWKFTWIHITLKWQVQSISSLSKGNWGAPNVYLGCCRLWMTFSQQRGMLIISKGEAVGK